MTETTKPWPEDWRSIHVSGASEDEIRTALEEHPGYRSVLSINDGDCGDVWGEKRMLGCRSHVTLWCNKDDVHAIALALMDVPAMIVSTDPNVWSERQIVLRKGIAHSCVHTPRAVPS
jgi:hypothetical protein